MLALLKSTMHNQEDAWALIWLQCSCRTAYSTSMNSFPFGLPAGYFKPVWRYRRALQTCTNKAGSSKSDYPMSHPNALSWSDDVVVCTYTVHALYTWRFVIHSWHYTYAACSNSFSSASSISTGLLAGLVIGWILFIATLIVCVVSIVLLVYSRRQIYGTKTWVLLIVYIANRDIATCKTICCYITIEYHQ